MIDRIFFHRSRAAFSLIELLVVLAIVSIVAVMAIPSLSSAMASSKLNSASQMLSDSIALARQEAVAKDRNVQVRFYKITSGTVSSWRAFQVFRMEPSSTGSSLVAVTVVRTLPDGIILSPTLSPLLTADPSVTGTVTLPVQGAATYGGFFFLPSGQVESALTQQNNFLTVQNATAPGTPPANYSTLQINLVTGKVILYRP